MVRVRTELDDLHLLLAEKQQDCLLNPAVDVPAAIGLLLGKAHLAGVEQSNRLRDSVSGLLCGRIAAEGGLNGFN